ncbi:MAG: cupin domain-containing protein [Pseudomonadales bacterium]|nr:cupin domain-containing protein [Pseudomonadales bacterium]
MSSTALSIITQSSDPVDTAGRNSEPVLVENEEHHWDDIFTLEDFEALLQNANLPADQVHVFYRGKNITAASNIPEAIKEAIPRIGNRYDNDRLFRAYSSNECSIRIINAFRFHPKINEMVEKLLDETRIMVSANIYYSPKPEQRILPLHKDRKEVYISQISGKKRMFFAEKNQGDPAVDSITNYIEYSAGDNLYIPMGVPHCGQSIDGHSLHLTWGFRAHSISRFLQYVLSQDESLNRVLEQSIGLKQNQQLEPDYEALEKCTRKLQKTIGRALRDRELLDGYLKSDRIACDL